MRTKLNYCLALITLSSAAPTGLFITGLCRDTVIRCGESLEVSIDGNWFELAFWPRLFEFESFFRIKVHFVGPSHWTWSFRRLNVKYGTVKHVYILDGPSWPAPCIFLASGVWLVSRMRQRDKNALLCAFCGYSLHGQPSNVCSECGAAPSVLNADDAEASSRLCSDYGR